MTEKNDIKFDGSDKEAMELGLIDANGNVITDKREKYNLYMKESDKRNKYRGNKELLAAGIIDKNGKILDHKALDEYEKKELDAKMDKIAAEQENKKTGLFKSAINKLKQKFAKKQHVPQKTGRDGR